MKEARFTEADIDDYLAQMHRGNVSPEAIRRAGSVLRDFYGTLDTWGQVHEVNVMDRWETEGYIHFTSIRALCS